jgi:hypothetical protein
MMRARVGYIGIDTAGCVGGRMELVGWAPGEGGADPKRKCNEYGYGVSDKRTSGMVRRWS